MSNFTSVGFSLNKEDAMHILKVCGYSCLSALAAAAIALLAQIQVPAQYMFLVPIANTLLVALEKWITNNQSN